MKHPCQLLCERRQTLIFSIAVLHLCNQFCHSFPGILLECIAVLGLLLVDMEQVLLEDLLGEGRLDIPDALFGKESLLGIRGKNYHVDVDAVLLLVEGGVPPQMVQLDFIAPGDVTEAGLDQHLPVRSSGIPQPFRVLPTDRHYRRPDVAGMLRYLPDSLREICHLSIGIPEAVISQTLRTGAVGDVVQVVLLLAHRCDVFLMDLLDQLGGVGPGGLGQVVLVLQQFLTLREVPEQTLDVVLLLLCSRQIPALVRQDFHAGACRQVADTIGPFRAVTAALEVGGHEPDSAHASSVRRRC